MALTNVVSTDITDALGKKQIIRTMNYRGSLMSTSVKLSDKQLEEVGKAVGNAAYLCNIGAHSIIKGLGFGFDNPTDFAGEDSSYTFSVYPVLLNKLSFEYDSKERTFAAENFVYIDGVKPVAIGTVKNSASKGVTGVLPDIFYNACLCSTSVDTLFNIIKDALGDDDNKKALFEKQKNNMNVGLILQCDNKFGIKVGGTINMFFEIEYVEGSPSSTSGPEIAYGGDYKPNVIK